MRLRDLLEEKKLTADELLASIKDGRFTIDGSKLTVTGSFDCSFNQLTSLTGAPSSVGGNFHCSFNKLTSLEGAPSSVGGNFYCYSNQLTSLTGAPSSVGGNFHCSFNKLTSLKDVHMRLKEVNGDFYADGNPIKSHVLGLLLINGLSQVKLDNKEVQDILNNHLPNTKGHAGVLDCQSKLLDAGFEEYAQL